MKYIFFLIYYFKNNYTCKSVKRKVCILYLHAYCSLVLWAIFLTSIYLWNTVLKFLYCSQIKYYFEFPASCKLSFKVKIELLPFEYTMFHFSRFRNTSALLYLHITTTVFRCVSTVCKHLGYARANIVFFITFLSLKTNWIIKKSQDRFINILIEQDVHYFASKFADFYLWQ